MLTQELTLISIYRYPGTAYRYPSLPIVTFLELRHNIDLFRVMIVHVIDRDDDMPMVLTSRCTIHVQPQRTLACVPGFRVRFESGVERRVREPPRAVRAEGKKADVHVRT